MVLPIYDAITYALIVMNHYVNSIRSLTLDQFEQFHWNWMNITSLQINHHAA